MYERARLAKDLDDVLVATDDERIYRAVRNFGGKAIMTSTEHRSGTDRVAEAIASDPGDVGVNVQGDEPMLDPKDARRGGGAVPSGDPGGISDLKKAVFHETEFTDPAVVKVVTDPHGIALYFSRSLIPYPRNRGPHFRVFEHVGIYAYTRRAAQTRKLTGLAAGGDRKPRNNCVRSRMGFRSSLWKQAAGRKAFRWITEEDLERVREALRGQTGGRLNVRYEPDCDKDSTDTRPGSPNGEAQLAPNPAATTCTKPRNRSSL